MKTRQTNWTPRACFGLGGAVSFLFLLTLVVFSSPASAQSHFRDCVSMTGNNATVVVPLTASIQINDQALKVGDELAIFTHKGLCVGHTTWTGQNLAFAIWGNNILTEQSDGLGFSETLSIKVWDAQNLYELDSSNSSIRLSFSSEQAYSKNDGRYAPDAIFVLSELIVASHPESFGQSMGINTP